MNKTCILFHPCILAKPEVLDLDNAPSSPLFQTNPVELKAAAKKQSESKPYLFFKEKSPLRISHKQTKPFELTFSVKGLQPIKMRWTKDDRELLIGTRYKTFDSGRRLVVDPPFTPEDSGTYSVSACNSIGCTVRGVQVLIYGKKIAYYSAQKSVVPLWLCIYWLSHSLLFGIQFMVFRYSFFGTIPSFFNQLLYSLLLIRSTWNLQ